jgi:hypothetical protein
VRIFNYHFAHEAAGALGTRHSPRPLWGGRFWHNPGASRRGNAKSYLDVIACDKREAFAQGSDLSAVAQRAKAEATKQSSFVLAEKWIASRSLSSGAHWRDPLARNDGRAV